MRVNAMLIAAAVLLLGSTIVFSQNAKVIKIDGDGDFHLGTSTVVGEHVLKPGMYRVTISHVNGRHEVVFYEVPMKHSGKGMWPGARTELFRVEVASERNRVQ